MIVVEITDHVQAALDRLLQQYKGRPYIEGLLTALVQQIQDLEDAAYPLDKYRQLNFAYGAQLDGLGEIIGLKRNGLSDAEYYILLLGTIAENNSDTTAMSLRYIVMTCFIASSVFIKDPNSCTNKDIPIPAQVAFGVGDPQVEEALYTLVEQIIQNSVGASIAVSYITRFNAAKAFSTAGPQPWCAGCSSIAHPTSGGLIGALIYQNSTQ